MPFRMLSATCISGANLWTVIEATNCLDELVIIAWAIFVGVGHATGKLRRHLLRFSYLLRLM
jgi:hypothetical protein